MGGVFLEGERARAVRRPALTLFFRDGKSVFPARQNTSHKHNGPAPHPAGSCPGGPGPDGRRRGRRQEGGEAEGRERVDRCVFFFSVRVASARQAELPAAVWPGGVDGGRAGLPPRPPFSGPPSCQGVGMVVGGRRRPGRAGRGARIGAPAGSTGALVSAIPPPPLAPFKRKLPRERAAGGVSGSPRPLLPPPLPCDVDCTRIVRVGGVWCVEPRPVGADEKEAARSELKRRSLFLLLSALLCLLRIVPYVASSGAACTLCMCWHCRARGNWGRAAPCSALRRGGGERTRTRFRKTRSRSLSLLAHP